MIPSKLIEKTGSISLLARVLSYAFVIAFGMANFWSSISGDHYRSDLAAFVVSGHAALNGLNPYDVPPGTIDGPLSYVTTPDANPPVLLPFFQALSHIDFLTLWDVWFVISLLLYVGIISRLWSTPQGRMNTGIILWAMCMVGLWSTLRQGQIYIILFLFVVGALSTLKQGRHVVAGILIGVVVSVKPNFVLWPIMLLLCGFRKTAATSLCSIAAIGLIPILLYGFDIYHAWFEGALRASGMMAHPANASLWGLAARFDAWTFGLVMSGILVAASGILVVRFRPNSLRASHLALATTLIASPLAWPGYIVFLLPMLLERKWSPVLVVATAFLLLPTPVVDTLYLYSPILSSAYTVALLAFFVTSALDAVRPTRRETLQAS